MDPDLVLIFPFVTLMVLIVFGFAKGIYHRVATHDERKLELIARTEEARAGNGGDGYRKLEERVRVLERIATEGNSGLAAEIESLRNLQDLDVLPDSRERAR